MMGKTHAAVGAATALVAARMAGQSAIPAVFVLGAAGGILADVDSKGSDASKLTHRAEMGVVVGALGVFAVKRFFSDIMVGIGAMTVIGIVMLVVLTLDGWAVSS